MREGARLAAVRRRAIMPRRMPGKRKILSVVGTRPNFMKTAPVVAALRGAPSAFEHVLVHTGQHYDDAMSRIFFEELGVGEPDHMLDVGSGSHAQQTARVMERLEPVLLEVEPDVVLVPGRRELDDGGGAGGGEAAASRSATSRRACAASTARCPRRSTASSPTRSPTCCSSTPPRRATTCWPRVPARPDPLRRQHDDRHARGDAADGSTRAGRAGAPRPGAERLPAW